MRERERRCKHRSAFRASGDFTIGRVWTLQSRSAPHCSGLPVDSLDLRELTARSDLTSHVVTFDEAQMIFVASDTRIGLAREHRGRIFEPLLPAVTQSAIPVRLARESRPHA